MLSVSEEDDRESTPSLAKISASEFKVEADLLALKSIDIKEERCLHYGFVDLNETNADDSDCQDPHKPCEAVDAVGEDDLVDSLLDSMLVGIERFTRLASEPCNRRLQSIDKSDVGLIARSSSLPCNFTVLDPTRRPATTSRTKRNPPPSLSLIHI